MTLRPLLAAVLTVALVAPADAQTLPDLDRRVTRLEREVTRVSKRVLPKGEQTLIEPEIAPAAEPAKPQPPAPASAASVNELADRMSAIERRQREITAQIEEQGNRLRQVEERLAKFQPDAETRLGKLEVAAAPPPAPVAAPPSDAPALPPAKADARPKPAPKGKPASKASEVPVADTGDAAEPTPAITSPELRYKAAYALVEAKDWAKAGPALQAFIDKYPKNKLASNARYWLGRTYFKQAKYDASARTHFDNYKADPKGDRAQESLFWVGQSLMQLKKAKEACQVFDIADKVYADTLKPELKPQFAAARAKAGCS